jgi:hypothetical protein
MKRIRIPGIVDLLVVDGGPSRAAGARAAATGAPPAHAFAPRLREAVWRSAMSAGRP